jgi:hypothetical protein
MKRKAIMSAAAVLIGLLTGCARSLLTPDEQRQVCHVVVAEKFGSPVFKSNVLSNPAGGLAGAGIGALQGAGIAPNILAVFTAPIGAAIGAAGGGACAMASLSHPTADADFEALLRDADIGVLARTLEAEFNAPRAECSQIGANRATSSEPDGVIEIEKVRVGMGCMFGQMEYWVAVDWRTVNLRNRKELNWTTTQCTIASLRNVDDWFAHRDQAQLEIEGVLAATGRRMVLQLLTQDVLRGECRLRSNEAGEIKAQ